jgi:hypothetical protein
VLSPAQQGLWFTNQLRPGDADFHVPVAFAVEGPVRMEALRRALGKVVERHEVLRCTYPMEQDSPVCRVMPAHRLPWSQLDVVDNHQDAQVSEAVDRFAREPFDLTTDLPIRAAALQVGTDRSVVVVCVHHIACDGIGLHRLCRELSMFLSGEPLPNVPVRQFAQVIAEQDTTMLRRQDQLVAFWRHELADPPARLFPDDHPAKVPATGRPAGTCGATLTARPTASLLRCACAAGVTIHMVLLAGFAAAIGARFDKPEVLVGTPVDLRGPQDVDVIGCLVSVVPIRMRISRTADLGYVRQQCLRAYARADLPAELIAAATADQRPRMGSLYETVINLSVGSQPELCVPGLRVRQLDVDLGSVQVPLDLDARLTDELTMALRYDRTLVASDVAEAIMGDLLDRLTRFDRSPT